MSCNNFLSINDNIITVKGINTNDVWNITVNNANFMLSKYNGRGPMSISIIPFPNIGDGLYGDIAFSVNNNSCFSGCIENVNGNGSYFNVSPKYVTLHEEGETYNVTVLSDCNKFILTNENKDLISTPENGNNYFTITSNTSGSFENIEIIVTNDCNGLQEIVYVSQKPSQESSNMLTVNPQYITLSGEDKDFKVNVISICNGNTNFVVNGVEGLTLTTNNNIINGIINSTESTTKTFIVKNDCESKTVTVKYDKINTVDSYLCIDSEENNCKTSTTYNFTTGTSQSTSYTINSSSNWYIYSYDSSKVFCSKNGNIITLTLGEDKSETINKKEIILKNKEGDEAIIEYTIGSSLMYESGVTFTFGEGKTEINVTADSNYKFTACVYAYKVENGIKEKLKWVNKSSNFKIVDNSGNVIETLNGGIDECLTVTFSATTATQNSTFNEYIVRLQEQETYSEIKINVTVNRSEQDVTDGYGIVITPESGEYNLTDANEFTFTVTPTYTYDGYEYFIGDNRDMMAVNTSYKGVSATTTFSPSNVTLSSSETNYDNIIYVLNVPDGVTTITANTTATTISGEITSAVTSSVITFNEVEQGNGLCLFQSDISIVEVGYESTSVTFSFVSQNDFECVEYEYVYDSGDSNWTNWLTIDDSDCENMRIDFSDNETLDERTVTLIFKQKR